MCASHAEAARIGGGENQDGSKMVCDMSKTLLARGPACRVISVGSNGQTRFEADVHKAAPLCAIDVFDGTLTGSREKVSAAHSHIDDTPMHGLTRKVQHSSTTRWKARRLRK